jgi:N utilization substance protein A
MVPRRIELVEYSDNVDEFLKNILNSNLINEIKINKRIDGTKQAIVVVDSKKKGVVVGKEGRNAEKARLLARRYFQISNVLILSPEQTTNDNNGVNI